MKPKHFILALLSAALISTTAFAQPGPGMGRGMGMRAGVTQTVNQQTPLTDEQIEQQMVEQMAKRREFKLKMMKVRLNLSDSQVSKIEAIMKKQEARKIEHFKKMKALRDEQMIQRQETELSILSLLDDDQKKDFAVLKGQRRMMGKKHRGGKGGCWNQQALPPVPPAPEQNDDN